MTFLFTLKKPQIFCGSACRQINQTVHLTERGKARLGVSKNTLIFGDKEKASVSMIFCFLAKFIKCAAFDVGAHSRTQLFGLV